MIRKATLLAAAVAFTAAIGGIGVLSAGESAPAPAVQPSVKLSAPTSTPDAAASQAGPDRGACARQTWPHVAPECLAPATGAAPRKVVRTIALSTR